MDNRDYFWDNLKAFLMVLVIFGHTVTSLREVKEITGLYYFVYTFHMPLFVFTSGFMAKTIMRDGKFRAGGAAVSHAHVQKLSFPFA